MGTPARALAVLALLAAPGCAGREADDATLCFTPGDDCTAVVAGEIAKAERTLLVQAYGFTDPVIIQAILEAHARGVAVTVILDKTAPKERGGGADPVRRAGIPTFLDRRPRIAHNKVMVIDDAVVITGSFNFSRSANTRNAENLLVLRGAAWAARYTANFRRRLAVSAAYDGAAAPGE